MNAKMPSQSNFFLVNFSLPKRSAGCGRGWSCSIFKCIRSGGNDASIKPEVTNEVDVLVVGGGTAGTKTLLVERNFQLGGATTTG